jgi:hypothetical protein
MIAKTLTAALLMCLCLPVGVATGAGKGRAPELPVPAQRRVALEKEHELMVPVDLDEPPDEAGTTGDGSNDLSFRSFRDGDVVVAIESWSVGHAGIWDARYAQGDYSSCVWSAVKSSPGCVVREAPARYRTYDRAFGLYVPGLSTQTLAAARSYCAAQSGKPYDISASKSDESRWYCSKLVWAGYSRKASRDIDANGGYWVSPSDIYSDSDTRVFASGN